MIYLSRDKCLVKCLDAFERQSGICYNCQPKRYSDNFLYLFLYVIHEFFFLDFVLLVPEIEIFFAKIE